MKQKKPVLVGIAVVAIVLIYGLLSSLGINVLDVLKSQLITSQDGHFAVNVPDDMPASCQADVDAVVNNCLVQAQQYATALSAAISPLNQQIQSFRTQQESSLADLQYQHQNAIDLYNQYGPCNMSSTPIFELFTQDEISQLYYAAPDACPCYHYHGTLSYCGGYYPEPDPSCGWGCGPAPSGFPPGQSAGLADLLSTQEAEMTAFLAQQASELANYESNINAQIDAETAEYHSDIDQLNASCQSQIDTIIAEWEEPVSAPTCGNGAQDPGEMCEEGLFSFCLISERCENCECVYDETVLEEECGNGVVEGSEQCEPGAVACTDTGYSCAPDCSCTPVSAPLPDDPPPPPVAECGDGVVTAPEQCEPGAVACVNVGFSCEPDCSCTPNVGTPPPPPPPPGYCGDGINGNSPGEQCDDGNNVDLDGCDKNCQIECGNNVIELPLEQCDDGNRVPLDGCDANCQIECGNGVLELLLEECDDGNRVNNDGCDQNCKRECGNGVLNLGEACDDGNNVNGDGCDAACKLETSCGDGVLDPNGVDNINGNADDEECDDGNNVNGDGCDKFCKIEVPPPPKCGDGIVGNSPGEQCDPAGSICANGQICTPSCQCPAGPSSVCGNGIVEAAEECDDANGSNGDGCDNNCKLEAQTSLAPVPDPEPTGGPDEPTPEPPASVPDPEPEAVPEEIEADSEDPEILAQPILRQAAPVFEDIQVVPETLTAAEKRKIEREKRLERIQKRREREARKPDRPDPVEGELRGAAPGDPQYDTEIGKPTQLVRTGPEEYALHVILALSVIGLGFWTIRKPRKN